VFEWDDGNIEHLAPHAVEPDEAEEALLDTRRIGMPAHQVAGERRWAALGATESGRVLFVVFTRRGRQIRVISARDATARERRRYRR
jgi:uncharacterized DUF497 family protein